MALKLWRFQADIQSGDIDPMVTVFVGPERVVMDANGEPTDVTFVEQSTVDPLTMKLSELPAMLASGTVTRATKA